MSGLAGWLGGRWTQPPGDEPLRKLAGILARWDDGYVLSATCSGGGLCVAAPHGGVDLHRRDECLAAVWGQPRIRDDCMPAQAGHRGAAETIADAHARLGTEFMSHISGHFALAILDGMTGDGFLAVDRTGTHPLCYSTAGGRLAFTTNLDAAAACAGRSADVDHQALYDYVHFHVIPAPQTVYTGWRRLLPGTCLLWHNGVAAVIRYWTMRFVEDRHEPFEALKRRFIDVLRDSVRDAASRGVVGTFLSGGTDSSTIAGMLHDVTGEPARTYSIGFNAEAYDEMSYARIAARHFATRHHEYYVTPDDVVAALPDIAGVHDQPFGNASAVPAYYCARLARDDGVDTLLGGDGGDELFGGNERYAKQYLYSLYGDLPAPLRKAVIEPIAMLVPSVGIAGRIKRYMSHASAPMPDRYDNYNLLQRLGPATVFTADFLSRVDTHAPAARVARDYAQAHAATLINRMLALDLTYTLADNDLPKVTRSCELAGVDVRFPLLDDRVVEFAAALTPELKLKGTRLRYFFKEALRGYLPDAIIAKGKHGFGLPFGLWLTTDAPLRELAFDRLATLKRRNIVRPEFVDELTSMHVRTHAAYYGTMVWILTMLEMWFASRESSVPSARHGNGSIAACHDVAAPLG